jgi:hypothetical protein
MRRRAQAAVSVSLTLAVHVDGLQNREHGKDQDQEQRRARRFSLDLKPPSHSETNMPLYHRIGAKPLVNRMQLP